MKTLIKILAVLVLILHTSLGHAVTEIMANQGTPGTRGAWFFSKGVYATAVTQTTLAAEAGTCLVVGGAKCSNVLASTEIGWYENVTVWFYTGAATVENVLVSVSPDGTNWFVYDNWTFVDRPVTSLSMLKIANNSWRYLKVDARASAESAVKVWLTAN